MDIDFKQLAPWNWFKKEQEEQQSTASLPVQRNDLPVPMHYVHAPDACQILQADFGLGSALLLTRGGDRINAGDAE